MAFAGALTEETPTAIRLVTGLPGVDLSFFMTPRAASTCFLLMPVQRSLSAPSFFSVVPIKRCAKVTTLRDVCADEPVISDRCCQKGDFLNVFRLAIL